MQEEGAIFDNLQKEVKKPTRPVREGAVFISEATYMLAGQRTSLRRRHPAEQRELRMSMRCFQA